MLNLTELFLFHVEVETEIQHQWTDAKDSYEHLALGFIPISWGDQVAQPCTASLCCIGLGEKNLFKGQEGRGWS